MMSRKLQAAIAGLGNVGLLFDQDARRSGVWTHFSAYERLEEQFDLVSVCDPDEARREMAEKRKPGLGVHLSLSELLDADTVDVVSLCTPPELHAEQILQCAGRVRAVICEKPLAVDSVEGRLAVEACADAGTILAVNYYKRFDGCVPVVKAAIVNGDVGAVKSVNATFCGPLDAVGSHMIDLLRFLFGDLTVDGGVSKSGDRWAVLLRGENGILVHLHDAGPREEFIFELDVLGNEGRLRLLNNCRDVEYFRYRDSERYSGYRELFPGAVEPMGAAERFLPLFVETAEALRGERSVLTSDGANALRTQMLIDEVARTLNV